MNAFTPGVTDALFLSVKLAGISTLVLLLLGVPLAWWLSRSRGFLARFIHALVTLPLILPPTVLGYYLLVAFAADAPLGSLWQQWFNISLAFSFSGLVLASMVYSLPFAVQPLYTAFSTLSQELVDVADSLGANYWQKLWYVVLPMHKRALLTAAVLVFAHTIGEFGVVLLIGGNIPGETRVLSVALYDLIETMQLQQANLLAGSLLAFSLCVLLCLSWLQAKKY